MNLIIVEKSPPYFRRRVAMAAKQAWREPSGRHGHSTATVGGELYMWAGSQNGLPQEHNSAAKRTFLSRVDVFNVETGCWSERVTCNEPPMGVLGYSCIAVGEDLLYFGGWCGHKNCYHNSVYSLNTATLKWKCLAPTTSERSAPMKKFNCGMVHFTERDEHLLYVIGGRGVVPFPKQLGAQYKQTGSFICTNEQHIFSLSSREWSQPATVTGQVPSPCSAFTLTPVGKNTAALYGGWDGSHLNKLFIVTLGRRSVTWSSVGQQVAAVWPERRYDHAATQISDSAFLVIGGRLDFDAVYDCLVYNNTTKQWKTLNIDFAISGRWGHTVSAIQLHKHVVWVVVFGGFQYIGDTAIIELIEAADGHWNVAAIQVKDSLRDQNLYQRRLKESRSKCKPNELVSSSLQKKEHEKQNQRQLGHEEVEDKGLSWLHQQLMESEETRKLSHKRIGDLEDENKRIIELLSVQMMKSVMSEEKVKKLEEEKRRFLEEEKPRSGWLFGLKRSNSVSETAPEPQAQKVDESMHEMCHQALQFANRKTEEVLKKYKVVEEKLQKQRQVAIEKEIKLKETEQALKTQQQMTEEKKKELQKVKQALDEQRQMTKEQEKELKVTSQTLEDHKQKIKEKDLMLADALQEIGQLHQLKKEKKSELHEVLEALEVQQQMTKKKQDELQETQQALDQLAKEKSELQAKAERQQQLTIEKENKLKETEQALKTQQQIAEEKKKELQKVEQALDEQRQMTRKKDGMLKVTSQTLEDHRQKIRERELKLADAIQEIELLHQLTLEKNTKLHEALEALELQQQITKKKQDELQETQQARDQLAKEKSELQESLEKSQNRTKELEDGNVLIAAVKEMEEKISQLELEKKQKVLSLKESEQRYKEAKLENKAAKEALECSLQRCKKLENETEQHQQQLNQSLEMSQQVVTAAKARTEEAVLEAVQLQDEYRETVRERDEVIRKKEEEIKKLKDQIDAAQPHWIVKRNEVEMTEEVVGRGGWGVVKVAKFRGLRVAAKTLDRLIISQYNVGLFMREMNITARLRHPNLLLLVGAITEGEPVILTELMPTSLRKELEKKDQELTRKNIISISRGVSCGLTYMHESRPQPIIHRDISSGNILLELSSDGWRAKISDYGSANCVSLIGKTVNPGNPTYSAPEAFFPNQHTPKMDVYSFGILLVEVCLREFPESSPDHRAAQIQRIKWPAMVSLIKKCIQTKPASRPSANQMMTIVNGIRT